MNTFELDQNYIAHTYARFPVNIVGGKGAVWYDETGKEYIDMGSGIGVNIFGMCDSAWVEAVTAQLGKCQHTSNLYYSDPCAELAQMLCSKTGMKKVFFSNSGAEANECAIKAARKYAAEKKGADCYTVVTLENSFHGRTITTLAANGQEAFHRDFQPLTPGFVHARANDIEDLRRAVAAQPTAALMLECVQGEGGVIALEADFVREAARLAQEQDVLLIVDEVQAGNGRTGALYAYMHYGITPDIVTTAKGLGGGLPLGATLLGERVQDVYTPGTHGSTFGGNPVCCAGAKSILQRIDQPLLDSVLQKEQLIRHTLETCPGVKCVTGKGLMLGVETERDAGEVIADCIAGGVLPLKAKTKVRLLPPLNITTEQLQRALKVLCDACCK